MIIYIILTNSKSGPYAVGFYLSLEEAYTDLPEAKKRYPNASIDEKPIGLLIF